MCSTMYIDEFVYEDWLTSHTLAYGFDINTCVETPLSTVEWT